MNVQTKRKGDDTPFLSLKSIEYSLTEGTNIPAPVLEDEAHANKKSKLSSAKGGPLSSHPVTPDGNIPSSAFPSLNTDTDGFSRPYEASPTGRAPTHVEHTPPYKRTRRPSIAQRFLRSIGSKRSLNSGNTSSANLAQTPNGGRPTTPGGMSTASRPRSSFDKLRDTLRGSNNKRPMTPGAESMMRPETPSGMPPPQQRPRMAQTHSGSIPQMVRKRSMDFIGSARRMSGVWSRSDAMDQERKTERIRGQMDREARIMRQPAPTLPVLREGLGMETLDGDALFGGIGREDTWIVSGKA